MCILSVENSLVVDNSAFMGAGVSISMEEDTLALKAATIYNSELANNTESGKSGGLVLDWGSIFVDSIIGGNEAVDADIWLYTSVFAALRSNFSYNEAGEESGIFFRAFSDESGTPLPIIFC